MNEGEAVSGVLGKQCWGCGWQAAVAGRVGSSMGAECTGRRLRRMQRRSQAGRHQGSHQFASMLLSFPLRRRR